MNQLWWQVKDGIVNLHLIECVRKGISHDKKPQIEFVPQTGDGCYRKEFETESERDKEYSLILDYLLKYTPRRD